MAKALISKFESSRHSTDDIFGYFSKTYFTNFLSPQAVTMVKIVHRHGLCITPGSPPHTCGNLCLIGLKFES